jgi:hypothetical protein
MDENGEDFIFGENGKIKKVGPLTGDLVFRLCPLWYKKHLHNPVDPLDKESIIENAEEDKDLRDDVECRGIPYHY